MDVLKGILLTPLVLFFQIVMAVDRGLQHRRYLKNQKCNICGKGNSKHIAVRFPNRFADECLIRRCKKHSDMNKYPYPYSER